MFRNFKISVFYGLFFFMVFLVSGCASQDATVDEEPGMTVNVDFREVHRCSRISPEITVAYAPHGTKFYDVRLVEQGNQERFLGGGTWQEDGSGLIPEGALTRHYTGPCPPADRKVEYVYVITAMENENSQPLAVRLFKWSPED